MTEPAQTPTDTAFSESSIFRESSPRSWAVSLAAHLGTLAALAALGAFVGVRTGVISMPSVVEFETPPRRAPTPPRPAPRVVAPTPAAVPTRATPSARSPSRSAARGAHHSAAPRVMAAQGSGGEDSMPVGDATDFQGGVVGGGGDGVAQEPVVRPPDAPPAPAPVRRRETEEVPEERLAVRAAVECDDGALAGLYPQAAIDGEVEIPMLALVMLIDAEGRIERATSRDNPGYGIAQAMERGALAHCRVTTLARDASGEAVRTRVVKRIRFQFE